MSAPTSTAYNKQQTPHTIDAFGVSLIRVSGIWPRSVYVQWMLRKPSAATGYTFTLARSGAPEGPWETIATVTDIYFFVDNTWPAPRDRTTPGLFSLSRSIYYRVSVSGPDGTSTSTSSLGASPDRRKEGMITKLRRDAAVVLKKGNGTEFAVFKRMWWGPKCSCLSATGLTTRSHCQECKGTGIQVGYWNPIYGFASRSAGPMIEQTASAGTVEVNSLTVMMLDIPAVAARDILVFLRDNKRYIVDRVNQTEIETVCIHQELVVSELPRSSVEYALQADRWHNPGWF